MQTLAIIISALALATSLLTAWLTLLRRGAVRMTHPSTIYFGADGGSAREANQKVYLRTLLFSTAKRGRVIENIYVSLRRDETQQNFSVWVMGNEKLARGAGLFVEERGIVANHHFLLPKDDTGFTFREGKYLLSVFIKLLDEERPQKLFVHELTIDSSQATQLKEPYNGLYFDWAPEAGRYISHIRPSPFGSFLGLDGTQNPIDAIEY